MKGKYGVPMNGMEHRPKKHYCKQCEYYKSKCSKKPKYMQPKQPTTCKHFKKKWKDAKAGECVTYYIGTEKACENSKCLTPPYRNLKNKEYNDNVKD